MSLSVEELLKPRYKVIAPFPRGFLPVGTVFILDNESVIAALPNGKKKITSSYYYSEPEECPNIFKELKFWEERRKEDLPKYIKYVDDKGTEFEKTICLEVKEWIIDDEYTRPDDFGVLAFKDLISTPITLEEYNAYQSSIKDK